MYIIPALWDTPREPWCALGEVLDASVSGCSTVQRRIFPLTGTEQHRAGYRPKRDLSIYRRGASVLTPAVRCIHLIDLRPVQNSARGTPGVDLRSAQNSARGHQDFGGLLGLNEYCAVTFWVGRNISSNLVLEGRSLLGHSTGSDADPVDAVHG